MPTQTSFSELEYAAKKKLTRRDRFLTEIEAVTPWEELVAVIEPHYPKGGRGRPPIGVERMLRMYIAQNCFGLSDEGIEDALYVSPSHPPLRWHRLGARGRTGCHHAAEVPPPARREEPHCRDLRGHQRAPC